MVWGCAASSAAADPAPQRSLFVSVIEEKPVLSDRGRILRLVDYAGREHFKTLFVQVYRSNKAWFKSRSADS